jgi:hypothetical protein
MKPQLPQPGGFEGTDVPPGCLHRGASIGPGTSATRSIC